MRTRKKASNVEDEMEARLIEFTELFYGASDNSYPEEMKKELKKEMGKLRPAYRDVIVAYDFEGFGYKEIALRTGIPEGTLMSRRHRALSLLHKNLTTKGRN